MKKIICALLSLVLITGMISPLGLVSHAAAPEIYTEIIGDVRIQVLSGTLIRLEVKGPEGFEDRETFHIVNRTDWTGANVTRTATAESTVLKTDGFTVTVKNTATALSDISIVRTDGAAWSFDGLPSNKVALPEPNERVDFFEIADTPRIIPSEESFTPSDSTDNNGWDLSNNADDMYIFMPENESLYNCSRELRKEFVKLTGQTEMLSLSALGAWDSRYYAYTDETALQQIDDYHSRNLPLDNLVIDTDWRDSTGGTGYNINTALFPSMSTFLSLAHRKKVNIIFNDHPEPTQTNGEQNNVLNSTEVNFRYTHLTDILKLGVDGWWYDRNWFTTVKPLEGFTHEVMGMALYADAAKSVYPNRRLYMMSNVDGINNGFVTGNSNIAAHRYAIEWTGDTYGGQATILQEINNAISFGSSAALPYVSTDLGAHQTHTNSINDNEYLRWIQFGALSPIFRLHVCASDRGRMPWLYGEEVTDIYRDYLNMRYRLLPVFYQLSNESYNTGLPMLRKMTFNYPEYTAADRDDQYMLGDDIIVAPVTDLQNTNAVPAEWLTASGKQGLTAEYFNNTDCSGTSVYTQTVPNINFNIGNDSPAAGVNADGFSIRYTGKITIGDSDVLLQLSSDDGSRLFIDGEQVIDNWADQTETRKNTEITLEAGKTYDIKVEYYDSTGGAVCRLNYVVNNNGLATRTVWIPEGQWTDLNTGRVYEGPATYNTVSDVSETPMFVKTGSVTALADETLSTKTSSYNWSHITLDVYPSTTVADESVIYEDDTESNAYQEGEFRTTNVSTSFDKATTSEIIRISAADGSFSGSKAFTDRNWTVRIHSTDGFGKLTGITVDGKSVDFETIAQDSSAMPFEISGGSPDGTVYTVSFKAAVSKSSEIRATFASAADIESPAYRFDKATVYDSHAQVTREVAVNEHPETVDLTAEGAEDWLIFNDNICASTIQKADGANTVSQMNIGTSNSKFNDCMTSFSWTDGDLTASAKKLTGGIYSNVKNGAYEIVLRSDEALREAKIYYGGWCSEVTAEVYDESGKDVTERYVDKNMSATYLKEMVIRYSSEQPTTLHVKLKLTDTSYGNQTLAAVAVKRVDAEDEPTAVITSNQGVSGLVSDQPIVLNLSNNAHAVSYLVTLDDGKPQAVSANTFTVATPGLHKIEVSAVLSDGSVTKPVMFLATKNGGLPGDLDFDGNVTVSDVVALRKLIMSGSWTAAELSAGDIDADGKLTVSDVVALRKLIMNG